MQNLKKNWFFVSKITRIWRILTWVLAILKISTLIGSFSCKEYNVWPKKVQRSYVSWQWRMMKNLKRNGLFVSKLTREIWQILTRALFWSKYRMFDLRKYREIMFDGTEYWWKIWRKTDLFFHKWHEEFWQIFTGWKIATSF